MNIKNVTVAGGGVIGSQIAYQVSLTGYKTTLYSMSEEDCKIAQNNIEYYSQKYVEENILSTKEADNNLKKIDHTFSLEKATMNADIIIEAIPENLATKTKFYDTLNETSPEHTIFATNTSTLDPNDISKSTGRPKKFITLHFANEIWNHNIAEVMKTNDTSEETFKIVSNFASNIGMEVIPILKTHPGYIFNKLLVPWLNSAFYLLGEGISDFETIDKTWKKATGDKYGPFAFIDIIGLNTCKNIIENNLNKNEKNSTWVHNILDIFSKFIQNGRFGKMVGKGFYNYPNPSFEKIDFFNNSKEIQLLKHGFNNITVAGGGTLGCQIAYQIAYYGYNVSLYDIDQNALELSKKRIQEITFEFSKDLGIDFEIAQNRIKNINYFSDISESVKNADLLIEVVPEEEKIKKDFYNKVSKVLPSKTYIVTNTSTLMPSNFMEYTGRPEKFAALHFANNIWINNTGEVMKTSKTSEITFNKILAFARDINLLVIPIKKEQSSYILNTLLVPLLINAQELKEKGVADKEIIDKTWKIGIGANNGPFEIIGAIGQNTIQNIQKNS